MATGVYIYRELSPNASESLLKWLDVRGQLFEVQDPKGRTHYFIDNDVPRESDITLEIVGGEVVGGASLPGCTVGFALFTVEGDYIGSYRSLDKAIKAAENVKIVVSADVKGAQPDEDWNSMAGVRVVTNVDPAEDEPEAVRVDPKEDG